MERRSNPVGANPTRQLLLQPEAVGAVTSRSIQGSPEARDYKLGRVPAEVYAAEEANETDNELE